MDIQWAGRGLTVPKLFDFNCVVDLFPNTPNRDHERLIVQRLERLKNQATVGLTEATVIILHRIEHHL